MKNIVLFRLSGDDAVWLADLDAGTVERADASAVEASGQQIQGVDFAVAANARGSAASHHYFPSR